ncbi:uncharacterized protein [Rutidosis leptorrhynchoides]|uniref:uncharacterized protein n=1 Tax=Rutidosis leptorrhynchoides TaxID=125765 RepID=UPI003A9996B0
MKILSINIRRFKVGGKVCWFRSLVSNANPIVAAIQETKSHGVNDSWVENLWGSVNIGYVEKQAVGRSGGLLLIWDSNIFVVNEAVEGEFFIAIKGKLTGYDTEIMVVNVYGPHSDNKKRHFWDSLDSLLRFNNVAWILCGDFNEVRHIDERQNYEFKERRASMFNDFIERNGLMEIPLLGKKFTRISDDGLKFSKLGRFLVSDNFCQMWSDLSSIPLDRKLTGHSPILLKNGHTDFNSKPFRVFDSWFDEVGVDKIIELAWKTKVGAHRPDTIFRLKLKKVKESLKVWSGETFGKLDLEIKELMEL